MKLNLLLNNKIALILKKEIDYEKILVLFLSLLALVFVACGKDKDIRDILDKEKISSEFNIVEENEKYFEFKDKDDNREVYYFYNRNNT